MQCFCLAFYDADIEFDFVLMTSTHSALENKPIICGLNDVMLEGQLLSSI